MVWKTSKWVLWWEPENTQLKCHKMHCPTFCCAWSGSKMFAKVTRIQRWPVTTNKESLIRLILSVKLKLLNATESHLLVHLKPLCSKQCGPRSDCSPLGTIKSGSTLFVFMLRLVTDTSIYRQRTISADDIFADDIFSYILVSGVWLKHPIKG